MTVQAIQFPPRLLPLGDAALTVEFGDEIAPEIHARVLGFTQALERAAASGQLPDVVEWVPTFRSVTVYFDPAARSLDACDAPNAALARLRDLALASGTAQHAGRRWRIPVCFDGEFAPDLDALAAARGLGHEEIVRLLTGSEFRVYMLGFLPGFPYLGGLPAACEVPRHANPRTAVPERSLAVAGRMCAVYPWASPGGWHLLGRTPVRLFDADAPEGSSPALLQAGDTVRWQAIDAVRYAELDAQAAAGRLDPATLRESEGSATRADARPSHEGPPPPAARRARSDRRVGP